MLNGRLKVLSIHAPDHHEGLAVSENILHLLKEIVLTLQALLSIWDEKTLSTMNSRSMLYQEFGLNLGTLGIISYIRNYENFDFSLDVIESLLTLHTKYRCAELQECLQEHSLPELFWLDYKLLLFARSLNSRRALSKGI